MTRSTTSRSISHRMKAEARAERDAQAAPTTRKPAVKPPVAASLMGRITQRKPQKG